MCMQGDVCLLQSLIVQEHFSSSPPSLYLPPPFLPLLLFLSLLPFSPPLLVRFSFSLPFPTPPFLPTSPFPPISSSLIPPLLSFRSLLFLVASFPSNPLFLSYSSINPTPSFFYPFILSYPSILSHPSFPSYPFFLSYPSIPFYLSFLPFHSFLSLLSITTLFSFLSLLLFLPFFSSYPSFTCSPPSLPLPHFFSSTCCCCCCRPTPP